LNKFTASILILNFYVFNTFGLYSQKYGAAWIVGYDNDSSTIPWFGKTELNFKSGNLDIKYTYGERTPYLNFTNASIGNDEGTLRYLTDGFRLYDSSQKIIPGGDSINYNRVWQMFNRAGVYPTDYNHVFLPMPGDERKTTLLLHFTLDYYTDPNSETYVPIFNMSKICWDSVTGNNNVVFKDSAISYGHFIKVHMACVRHANGRDWWIIIEDYLSNIHFIYLLDPTGIHLYRTQKIGIKADPYEWTGNSIFTPDGNKFIKYLRGYQIQIFNFNRCIGELENPQKVINEVGLTSDLNFLAVSPNSRFLYFNSDSLIWQYDLFSNDIKGSEVLVGAWDGYKYLDGKLRTDFYQMALAEDGKIYVSCRSGTIFIHVINNPNEKGTKCNFQLRGVELPALMFGSVPAMPNYKLGPIDQSFCDTLGIDNLPIAEFGYQQDTNQYLQISFRDLSYHNPEKWQWDFGDLGSPTPSSSDTSPIHIFSKSGNYMVCLTVKNSFGENTVCKKIQLGTITTTTEMSAERSIITAYPNPFKNKLYLNLDDYLPQDARFIIYDEFGNELLRKNIYSGLNHINLESFGDGVYFYSVYDKEFEIGKGKVQKLNN
jgi:hypothetical protein